MLTINSIVLYRQPHLYHNVFYIYIYIYRDRRINRCVFLATEKKFLVASFLGFVSGVADFSVLPGYFAMSYPRRTETQRLWFTVATVLFNKSYSVTCVRTASFLCL